MRKFASASALAAMVLTCAFALSPAALAASPQAAKSPARIQPGGPIGFTGGRPSFGPNTQNVTSDNWGGYAALRTGTKFRYVQATFFVPYVNCAATPNTFSGHWVGLDGLENSTVEQDGILAACNGSVPEYSAWYEMFPNPPVYKNVTLSPGDTVQASVYYRAGANAFELKLTDTTNGEHFDVTKTCPAGSVCSRTSAEAISEAPSSGSSILPLTDFSAEGYSSIKVTNRSGQRGGLRSGNWDTLAITTVNSGNEVLDQPTQIYRGIAFGMYWMRQS